MGADILVFDTVCYLSSRFHDMWTVLHVAYGRRPSQSQAVGGLSKELSVH